MKKLHAGSKVKVTLYFEQTVMNLETCLVRLRAPALPSDWGTSYSSFSVQANTYRDQVRMNKVESLCYAAKGQPHERDVPAWVHLSSTELRQRSMTRTPAFAPSRNVDISRLFDFMFIPQQPPRSSLVFSFVTFRPVNGAENSPAGSWRRWVQRGRPEDGRVGNIKCRV